jgi:hypothetical protein
LTQPITRELKDKVIRNYLQGVGRNKNAIDTGLGAGTVTNIIQEFNDKLGEYEPEAIRELAEQLRKAGISPNDCVMGSQVINKMIDLGIDKDKCLAAIEIIQTRSIEEGVTPEQSAQIVSQLFEISKSESMPLNEIPDYVRQKVQEKERLDSEVDVQQRQIQNLKAQADTLVRQNNLTMQNIGSYIALRNELANVGIPETDIEGAMNVIRNFDQQGFDANRIVPIASTTHTLKEEVIELSRQCLSFRTTLSTYQHWVPLIQAIIEVGGSAVGPNELRVLVESICWRAATDKVPTMVAAQAIMGQLNSMYRIIGFENEIKTKQLALELLQEKIQELNELWAAKLQAIEALAYLAARGVTNEHVLEFHNFFLAHRNRFNLATLVADLQRYVSMKHVLKQHEENIATRTYHSKSLHMELISLLQERKNLEIEIAAMSKRVDSLKKQTRPSASEDNSRNAKVDLPKEEKEKGRIGNSPRFIIDPEVTITAFTKSRSGQQGNDSPASAEQISLNSNPQSAKTKTTSTAAGISGINNKTDTQTSTTTAAESESTS